MRNSFIISTFVFACHGKNLEFGEKFDEKARPPSWVTPPNAGENRNVISKMVQWKYWKEQLANNLVETNMVHPELLMNYGCYCQIGNDNYYSRHGLPQDALDKVCQKWKRCLVCAAMDSGFECSPETTSYVAMYSDARNHFECPLEQNRDPCTRRTCQCDTQLISDIFDNLNNFDYEFTTAGRFDPSQSCKVAQTVRSGTERNEPDQCCGTYPNRFPFVSMGGQRACCGSKLFDTYSRECCDEFEVKLHGTCQLSNHFDDPCANQPCNNGGTCQKDGSQLGFFCQCEEKWTGSFCHLLRYPCVDKPVTCFNGGKQISSKGQCVCSCAKGFEGNRCQKVISSDTEYDKRVKIPTLPEETEPEPEAATTTTTTTTEKEETTSTTSTTTSTTSSTTTIFTTSSTTTSTTTTSTTTKSVTIEERLGPCNPSPCKNGGKCTETGSRYPWLAYKCTCKKGSITYSGKNCQFGPCDPNPCINGGTCSILEAPINGYQNFECACPADYLGYFCEMKKRGASKKPN